MTAVQPYQPVALRELSFMQRLFKQVPEENAVIEINNLLASKPLLEISTTDIDAIQSRYNLDVTRVYIKNVYEFYAVYLNHCLRNKKIDDAERKELQHLRTLLRLGDHDIDLIHTKLCSPVYRRRFKTVIKDGRLSEENEAMLDKLEKDLLLPSKLASKISEEVRGTFVRSMLDKIVAKQRISPAEQEEFTAVQKSLKVNVEVDKKTRQLLEHYKQLWQVENGPVPTIDIELNLLKGEQCHFSSRVQWHEERISRGLPYWKHIDEGLLFLTNKRVIFSGRVKNTSIRLEKVLSFKEVKNGIQLNKDAGKAPRLIFDHDSDIFQILFPRVMRASDW